MKNRQLLRDFEEAVCDLTLAGAALDIVKSMDMTDSDVERLLLDYINARQHAVNILQREMDAASEEPA